MFRFFIACYTFNNWAILCIFFSGGKYMVTNDRGAVSIKHAVMEGLARELWEHDEITPDAENQLIMSIHRDLTQHGAAVSTRSVRF